MSTSIGELNNMTDSEKRYRVWERLEEFHAGDNRWPHVVGNQWPSVLKDKWGMLAETGGNP